MSTDDSALQEERTMTVEQCRVALAAAREENAELRDTYLRAVAAADNTRKQAERAAEQRANQQLRSVSQRLLEVADNLERALAHAPEQDALRPGVQATLQQLQTALRQLGVRPIAVDEGAAFDPQLHEAISTQEGDVDHPTVAEVLQRGYMVDEQLLRPARVVVTIPARTG